MRKRLLDLRKDGQLRTQGISLRRKTQNEGESSEPVDAVIHMVFQPLYSASHQPFLLRRVQLRSDRCSASHAQLKS